MHERLEKIINSSFGRKIDKYCNSIWYIIAIGVICVISHSFNIPVVGAAFLTLLLVFALVFCKNSFTLIPFLLMCTFVMSEQTSPQSGFYNTPVRITFLCLMLIEIIVALIINFVYYQKWRFLFKRAYLTVSFLILTVALVFSGVGSKYFNFTGTGMAFSIAICMLLPYAIVLSFAEYEGRKSVEYFALAVIIAASAIMIMFFKQYIVCNLSPFDSGAVKANLKLGFVGPNTGAAIIALSIPLTFYFVYLSEHGYALMPLIVVEALFVFLSQSRASMVVAFPCTAILAIILCFKKKNGRLGYLISVAIIAVVAIIMLIVFREKIVSIVKNLFVGNTTGSGRTDLWKDGFSEWKSSFVFGISINYLQQTGRWYYSFHCTPLTYLYCAGIVGLLAYVYHRYKTIRLVFSEKLTVERIFIAVTLLVMLLNALLDIAMTSPNHLLYYSIMLALIECDVNETKKKNAQSFKNENVGGEDSITVEQSKNVEKSDLSDSQNINNVVEVK